ncbi:MAG TPA: thiamine pyrophosphate-dependent enzyme [Candidatus Udaeobacter sp.]|jgi:thiamine pyrophosphate-dependent acetolactate synthase large subunit-like protein|nr:thiamine pyrophosphate-dependent enzyme [Candidatus Udaeobacter sp.]
MKRFECLQAIAPLVRDELVVTTAGGATAEWNAVRPSDGNLQVKTLGLCSSIGLGLALSLPQRKVFVFDGDGALWMNLGSLATIGLHQPKNLIHICWDNKQYESSGGEPTVSTAGNIDFAATARSAGIQSSRAVSTVDDLKEAVSQALSHDGPHFIWARIEAGRAEVPPLRYDELENKYHFIRHIEETEGLNILRVPTPASYKLK